jgi:hypothetical protein
MEDDVHSFADPELSPLTLPWAWPGYIPCKCMTTLFGGGGLRKGYAIADINARISRGASMPDGSRGFSGPRSVISITREDLIREGMAWRYRAAGARLDNIFDYSAPGGTPFKLDEEGVAGVRELAEKINSHKPGTKYEHVPDLGVIYFDPLMSITPRNVSANEVYRELVVEPLDDLAFTYECAVALVNHTTKDGKTMFGSAAASQGPRMVLKVDRNKRMPRTVRDFYVYKTNITGEHEAPLRYTTEGEGDGIRVRWMGPELDAEPEYTVADKRQAPARTVPVSMSPAEMFRNLNNR